MKVRELIEELGTFAPEAEVRILAEDAGVGEFEWVVGLLGKRAERTGFIVLITTKDRSQV